MGFVEVLLFLGGVGFVVGCVGCVDVRVDFVGLFWYGGSSMMMMVFDVLL